MNVTVALQAKTYLLPKLNELIVFILPSRVRLPPVEANLIKMLDPLWCERTVLTIIMLFLLVALLFSRRHE